MDPITHILLTRTIIGTRRAIILAGIAPDAPFYLTYPAWVNRHGGLRHAFQHHTWPAPPPWMERLHHAFHSLPLALCAAGLWRVGSGRWPTRPLAAWVLHIVIDIPTHARHQWAPQFLWPLSCVTMDGIGWADAAIQLVNRVLQAVATWGSLRD